MHPSDPIERLRAICFSVGFNLLQPKAPLLERLRLLAAYSCTVDDAERMAAYARAVFRHYAEARPSEAFSELEERIVVVGCLLSDIGKTGPEHAGVEDQRMIVEMFSVEGVPDDTISVAHFIHTYFASDARERIDRFEALLLDPAMTIREFWNLHSGWTFSIAQAMEVPPEVVVAAATHHLIDNVNPEAIVGEDDRFAREFGDNEKFDRAEKLITLLDKYDAVCRRGRRTHHEAIAWLRDRIGKSPRYRRDPEIASLLSVLDRVLGVVHEPSAASERLIVGPLEENSVDRFPRSVRTE